MRRRGGDCRRRGAIGWRVAWTAGDWLARGAVIGWRGGQGVIGWSGGVGVVIGGRASHSEQVPTSCWCWRWCAAGDRISRLASAPSRAASHKLRRRIGAASGWWCLRACVRACVQWAAVIASE